MSEESQNMADVFMLVNSIKDSALLQKVKLINDHYLQLIAEKRRIKDDESLFTSKIGSTPHN